MLRRPISAVTDVMCERCAPKVALEMLKTSTVPLHTGSASRLLVQKLNKRLTNKPTALQKVKTGPRSGPSQTRTAQ